MDMYLWFDLASIKVNVILILDLFVDEQNESNQKQYSLIMN